MPRKPRKKSSCGIYHVMLRGINRQTIFEDGEDKKRLLEIIKKCKGKSNITIFAYCLMDNHIHLLIRERDEIVSKFIQRISASYVYWYNNKYERCGHLFQDRFKSETVAYASSFLIVLRYIHQNPVKAGLATNVLECKWTSMNDYLCQGSLVDTDLALRLFSPKKEKAIKMFTEYMQVLNDDQCLDNHLKVKISDQKLISYLAELGIPKSSILQQMEKEERNTIILELKK